MRRYDFLYLISKNTALIVESVGSGAIIGAIAGLLIGIFLTDNPGSHGYFILGGVVFGVAFIFICGLIRGFFES